MKKTILTFCLMATAIFGLAFQCENENNNNGNNSTYADLIPGTWLIDKLTVNGEEIPPANFGEIILYMHKDGTGLVSDNGVTENNGFTWSIDGSTLTIVERHGEHVFTINELNEKECTFAGNSIPAGDEVGDVVIHIIRQA